MYNLRFALLGSLMTIWALTLVAHLAAHEFDASCMQVGGFAMGVGIASVFLGNAPEPLAEDEIDDLDEEGEEQS